VLDLPGDGVHRGRDGGRQARPEGEAAGLDTPEAISDAGHARPGEGDESQALGQAQLVGGSVALRNRHHLGVVETVHGAGVGAAHEGVDEPDVGLAVPQRGQPEGVRVPLDRPQVVRLPEASHDLGAAAVVPDEVVPEADD